MTAMKVSVGNFTSSANATYCSASSVVKLLLVQVTEVFEGWVSLDVISRANPLMHGAINSSKLDFGVLFEFLGSVSVLRFSLFAVSAP